MRKLKIKKDLREDTIFIVFLKKREGYKGFRY